MQFVVMMDLLGTLTLPVAIVLTVVLVTNLAQVQITSFMVAVPLVLLIVVLFSPAFLILITTRKWIYLVWMFVYLFALPIWNFVLPVYSYWHFDDFSWGETRKVTGEVKGADDHGKKDGVFDPSKVPLKRWEDYERKRIRAHKRRERKLQELGPAYSPSVDGGMDDLYTPSSMNSGQQKQGSSGEPSPVHYFDPSKEAPGKASSGYYPTYRPQTQQAPPSPPAKLPKTINPVSSPHTPRPQQPFYPTQQPQQRPLYRPAPTPYQPQQHSASAMRGQPHNQQQRPLYQQQQQPSARDPMMASPRPPPPQQHPYIRPP
jgi:chitin synthase